MVHVAKLRTEEEAKKAGYPCSMCFNSERVRDDEKTAWRDGFCAKREKADARAKPTEFYLRKYC